MGTWHMEQICGASVCWFASDRYMISDAWWVMMSVCVCDTEVFDRINQAPSWNLNTNTNWTEKEVLLLVLDSTDKHWFCVILLFNCQYPRYSWINICNALLYSFEWLHQLGIFSFQLAVITTRFSTECFLTSSHRVCVYKTLVHKQVLRQTDRQTDR